MLVCRLLEIAYGNFPNYWIPYNNMVFFHILETYLVFHFKKLCYSLETF